MVTFTYRLGRSLSRFVGLCCIRYIILHRERAEIPGGYILACTHLSHVEPCLVTAVVDRQIEWMARIEFYKFRLIGWLLKAMSAFPVDRFGVPVSSIRAAIGRARAGRLVGIFPEGGVAHGKDSIVGGGSFKKGMCVIAYRAGVPVLPVVVLGTRALTRVKPWLPFKHARVQMIFGQLVHPPLHEPRRRVAREIMARDLQAEFIAIHKELCAACGFNEADLG